MKMKEYGQGKNPIQKESPTKFLGGKLAAKLGSKLPGKAGKIAGALLNPLGAIKNRVQAKRQGAGADPAVDPAAMAGQAAAAQQAATADPAAAADPTATAATAVPVDPTAAPMAKKRKYSK